MNQYFYLKGIDRIAESNKLDFMIVQLLVTTKRATQAAEIYRKMQLRQIEESDCPTVMVDCAVLELMIADSLSIEVQMNEKI